MVVRRRVLLVAAGAVALLAVAAPSQGSSSGATDVAVTSAPAATARATTSGTYRAPVPGEVTRLFDPPAVRWGPGHRGVDLAASVGQVVRAPAAGQVVFAGTVVGRGVVTVLHEDGLRTSLEPVEPGVSAGDTVGIGAALGTLQDRSGHDGLHWGVRDGSTYLDPLDLLGVTAPVVLLPPGG